MKTYNNIISILAFYFLLITTIEAQEFVGDIRVNEPTQTHIILLKDGTEKEGRVISIEDTKLTFLYFENENTEIYHLSDLSRVMVKGAKEIKFQEDDDLARRGMNRLFYQETGFPLEAGEVQYTTYWGIIHKFDYAISDGLTIGTGMVYPGYFTFQTKINLASAYKKSRARMGLNLNLAARPFRLEENGQDVTRWRGFIQTGLYATFGNPNRNVTVSMNVIPIFGENDFFGNDAIFSFNFGGSIRVGKNWRILYENVLGGLNNNDPELLTGIGFSWFNKKSVIKFGIHPSASFGFFNFPLSDVNLMHRLPVLSYSRNF